MATLRDIRRSIKAVTNTRQITKAMKMVAASKLRKVQGRMLDLRPYADKMRDVTLALASGSVEREAHPLFALRPRKTIEVIVLTSDKGLCGAFNTNILKAGQKFINELKEGEFELSISAIGKKAVDYFRRRNVEMANAWTGISGRLSYEHAKQVSDNIIERFTNGEIDEVHLVYNEFVTVMSQEVKVVKLLPLEPLEEKGDEKELAEAADFIYEPGQAEIFDALLPRNVEIQCYRSMLESSASEESARMTAMENASQNASEMIDNLTLVANKARQAVITKELMDIVGGVEALK